MLRAYTTDELGLVKVIEAPSHEQIDLARVVQTWGEPSRTAAINSLSADGASYVAVGRPGGVEILNAVSGDVEGFMPAAVGQGKRMPAGVCLMHSDTDSPASLLSCSQGGLARLHEIRREDGSAQCSFLEQSSWQAAANVECMVSSINIWHGNMRNGLQAVDISKAARLVALACNGSELSIWDLQQQQRSYQAKGNKPNRIGLVDKPWNTAVAFLPGSDGQKVVVGTAYHKLRLYDVKSRRPALDLEFGEAKITALAAEDNGVKVWAGNGMGSIECLDLRMHKMQGSLKGPGGSVRSLALHPELPIIASVGLDRFLRVHNTDSKALLCKVYLKQHLTAVAWSAAQSQTAAAEGERDENTKAANGFALHSDVAADDVAVEIGQAGQPCTLSSKRTGSHKKGKSNRKRHKNEA